MEKRKGFVNVLLLVVLMLVGGMSPSYAQQNGKDEISRIKQNYKDYIMVTGTSLESSKEAHENAKTLISFEIEEWLKSNGNKDVNSIRGAVAKLQEHVCTVNTQQGRMHRTFMYVKKSEVLRYCEGKSIVSNMEGQQRNAQEVAPVTKETANQVEVEPVAAPPFKSDLLAEAESAKEKRSAVEPVSTKEKVSDFKPDNVEVVSCVRLDKGKEVPVEKKKRRWRKSKPQTATVDIIDIKTVDPLPDHSSRTATSSRVTLGADKTAASGHFVGKRSAEIEGQMLKEYSESSVIRFLRNQKQLNHIQKLGKSSRWPSDTVVYVFCIDYNRVVRDFLCVSNQSVIDLRSGEKVDLKEYLERYHNFIWFTLK